MKIKIRQMWQEKYGSWQEKYGSWQDLEATRSKRNCSEEGFGFNNIRTNQRLIRSSTRMRITIMALIGWTLICSMSVYGKTLTEDEIGEIKTFIQNHNPDFGNFSYDQLQQWFLNQTPSSILFEEYPRLFPFCVTAKQINNPDRTPTTDHIYKFKYIFEDIEKAPEKFYEFKKDNHSVAFDKTWISEVKLSRINTPEMDMVNLRQWLHIRVKTTEPVQGLYMQTIVGPLGLPFGEFNLDFPCKDADESKKMLDEKIGELTYCSHRPRTTIQHPSVFVAYDPAGRQEFHVNYMYTDITCMESPYLQYMMIVVKDFKEKEKEKPKMDIDYKKLFSHVYVNTDFDSKSGAPFPYYPEWKDNMYCFLDAATLDATYTIEFPGYQHPGDTVNAINKYPSPKIDEKQSKFDDIDWKEDDETYRVQPNEAYDSCIRGTLRGKSLRDDDRLECPPGPYRCDESYADVNADVINKRLQLVKKEQNLTDCFPCHAPECPVLGFPDDKCEYKNTQEEQRVNESTELNRVESIVLAKAHGLPAVFAFLVLIPISNFLARFYKEVCGTCLCDNGPWIFIHIGTQIVSVVLTWLSLGPVMSKVFQFEETIAHCLSIAGDNKEKQASCSLHPFEKPHLLLGLTAFLMQHLLIAFGFWRADNAKCRNIQVILHSHFGYGCWLLGGLSAIAAGLEQDCQDIFVASCLLIAVPILFGAVGAGLDCATDKKVGIVPPRKQWPVLEAVKLEGRGPFTGPKWIVFGLYTLVMILTWSLALGSSLAIMSASQEYQGGKGKLGGLGGLFGCSAVAPPVNVNTREASVG